MRKHVSFRIFNAAMASGIARRRRGQLKSDARWQVNLPPPGQLVGCLSDWEWPVQRTFCPDLATNLPSPRKCTMAAKQQPKKRSDARPQNQSKQPDVQHACGRSRRRSATTIAPAANWTGRVAIITGGDSGIGRCGGRRVSPWKERTSPSFISTSMTTLAKRRGWSKSRAASAC